MKNQRHVLRFLALVLLVAMTSSCEDTDLTAPPGSIITLTASPSAVIIDQVDGEEQDQTTLVAQVTDGTGQPIDELPLFFASTGGLLSSVNNFCTTAGVCSRSPEVCTVDSDCPLLPPAAIQTNPNGVATDILTLRLFGDPDTVTVTVKGTGIEGTTTVDKIVNLGPNDPQPFIQANPPGGQRTGLPFTFDGSGSVLDPQEEFQCYDWQILSSAAVFDPNAEGCAVCALPGTPLCAASCTTRGKFESLLSFIIGSEGDPSLDLTMNVVLRVSGREGAVCTNTDPLDESIFGPNVTSTIYLMDCDLTDPIVDGGSDKSVSLTADGVGGTVFVSLDGTGSDPEDIPPLDYEWNCGTGGLCDPVDCKSQSVTCAYSSTGIKTATVTVTNDCLRQDVDTVQIDVGP